MQARELRRLGCLALLASAACGGATAPPDPEPTPDPSPDRGHGAPGGEHVTPVAKGEAFLRVTIAGQSRTVTGVSARLDPKENRMMVNATVARPGRADESLWIVFPPGEIGTFSCDADHGISYFEHPNGGDTFRPLTTDPEVPSILSVQGMGEVGAYVDGSFAGKLTYRDALEPAGGLEAVLASGEFHVKRSADR